MNGGIGTSGSPLTTATIVGGCSGGNPAPHPCSSTDNVYATTISQTTGPLTKPTVDLANAYATAQPGPLNNCTTGSMPGGFDNDTTMNRSRAQFDLTPGSSYDCRYVDGSGTTVGQLTWNAATSRLTAAGVIYFDGDIVSGGDATYTGLATIYSSGTVAFSNNATLCGIASCTSSWDAAHNLILFVAGSSTDQYGVTLAHGANVQAAAYAVDDVLLASGTALWGPAAARSVTISEDAGTWQPIVKLPPGAPGGSGVVPIPGTWRG